MSRQMLRQGISEHWTAKKGGTRLKQIRSLIKIKTAVEEAMLEKINTEETGTRPGDELSELAEQITTAEALAEGGDEASPESLRAKELRAAGKSYSAIAREIFEGVQVGSFHINKVKRMLGEASETAEAVKAEGSEPPQKKRASSRRNTSVSETIQPEKGAKSRRQVTPNDDGAGQPGDMVHLTTAEACKLWNAVTGGQIGFQAQGGEVTCQVSLESFRKALPALLGRL